MKASDFNNLSDKMIRKLAPNERAIYRVLNVRPDPDNPGKFLMPSALQIRPIDTILDKGTNEFVTIAAIERTDIDGNPSFISIVFTAANMGYLFLNGNNPVHQKIYQFLELCNYNESNPDRIKDDPEIEVLFSRIDAQKEAKTERNLRKLIVKAVNLALDLDDKKAKEVALALGIDAESNDELRNELEDYAGDYPEEFLEVVERASLANESALKDAVKKNIIKNDVNASCFKWVETGKVIFTYTKGKDKNYFKELADHLLETNPDELEAIKSRLG
jgi:DNA-dependent RNA polymerase auxiliary subunit epsilon